MDINQNLSTQEILDINEFTLKELIKILFDRLLYLKSKWKYLILSILIGLLIGFIVSKFEKPKYRAVLTFVLEEDKGNASNGMMGLASQFGFGISTNSGGVFVGENLLELMRSKLIIQKTLLSEIILDNKKITLAEYYLKVNHKKADDVNYINLFKNDKNSIIKNKVLNSIYEDVVSSSNLILGPINKKATIQSVEVNSTDELFSKIFCEKLIQVTSDYYIEIKSKKALQNFQILQYQTDSVRKELNNAISGVAALNDNTFNLNFAMLSKKVASTKKQIDVQANSAILTQLVANLEASKVNLRKETPLVQVIDYPLFPLEKKQIGKLKFVLIFQFVSLLTCVAFLLIRKEFFKA